MSGERTAGSALERLAEACGVVLAYRDGMGEMRHVAPDTLRSLLAALGFPVADDTEASARLAEMARPEAGLASPPSLAVRGTDPLQVPLRADGAEEDARLVWRLKLESGEIRSGDGRWGALAADGGGRRLSIPGPVPAGYHILEVSLGGAGDAWARSHVIAAPASCYRPASLRRCWGMGVQLYSLVSETNWGMGDYGDLARLGGMAAAEGADFVGLNPVHALFAADPGHFGPYGPSNRGVFNTAYIDPSAVPGFAACEPARRLASENAETIAALHRAPLVEYRAVDRIKRPALELLWRHFNAHETAGPAGRRFRAYRADRGHALHSHALFEALHAAFFAGGQWDWRDWPAPYRDPHSPAVAAFAAERTERVDFFAWLQWLAEEQLGTAQAAARRDGMRIGLYTDLAVGLDPGGSEAWTHQGLVPAGISVGAPPDALSLHGQNWGVAPLAPRRLAELGFDVFADAVRATMRHAGAMRIDHAMQLARLFWIPPGGTGVDGAYMRYPLEEMLAVIALESHRQQCLVIGEDLGTVPEGFRARLADENILTYSLFYFEREKGGGLKPPAAYPRDSLVAATTHDLPSTRGLIKGRDLDWRERLDLFPDEASREAARAERAEALERLIAALRAAGLLEAAQPSDDELVAALYAFLAAAPCRLLAIQAEDLAGALEQPNLPGTTDAHPNWRRKLPVALEELFETPLARDILAATRKRREGH